MCGVLEVRRGLDLGEEPLGANQSCQLGLQDLEGDLSFVLQVVGQVDGGHAAFAELALNGVAAREGGVQAGGGVGHGGQDASRACGTARISAYLILPQDSAGRAGTI